MQFNLNYFRESILKLTQSEFAEMMEKSQNTISRWEKDPDSLSIEVLTEISKKTGYSLADLLNANPKVNIPWKTNSSEWDKLKDFKIEIHNSRNRISTFINQSDCSSTVGFNDLCMKLDNIYVNSLEKIRKPKVAFLGNSDVGKSTLINAILGDDILPAGWSPITSLIIKVVHSEDKPEFLKDATTIVLSEENTGIDTSKLKNENYFNKHCIESGDKHLLEKYGSREGEMYQGDSKAEVIVIYIDSPILKSCELWDLPGYGTADDPRDDLKASRGKDNADIFVYMSLSSAFMRGSDMIYLKDIMDTMNPLESENNGFTALSNLFVIASQAHIVQPVHTLESLIIKGSDRMNSTLPDNYWDSRSKMTKVDHNNKAFNSRFFSYTRDDDNLSERFKTNFIELLENISSQLSKELPNKLKASISELQNELTKEIKRTDIYRQDMSKAIKDYEDLKSMEEEILKNNKKFISDLDKKLGMYKRESVSRFEKFYDDFISEGSIVSIIERKGYKNKKKDKEELQSFISNSLTQELNDICQSYSKKLKDYLDEELDNLNIGVNNTNTFDYKRAFISGLAGASTYGAFALYIGTLGNLGGYILVTKAVGLLSALGISVGGGAAATTAVAAIGGPVTIVIGLSILAGTLVATLTGLNWKKNLAKSLVKAYGKQDAKEKYCDGLKEWWTETEAVINKDMMITDYENQLKVAKEKGNVDSSDLDKLHDCLERLYNII